MFRHLLDRPLPRLSALALGIVLGILAGLCSAMGTGPYLLLRSLLHITIMAVLEDSKVASLLFEDDSAPVGVNVQYLVLADVLVWGIYALVPMPEVLWGLVESMGEAIISILLVHYLGEYRSEMEGVGEAMGSGEKVELVEAGGEDMDGDAVGTDDEKLALMREGGGEKDGELWVAIEGAPLGEKGPVEV